MARLIQSRPAEREEVIAADAQARATSRPPIGDKSRIDPVAALGRLDVREPDLRHSRHGRPVDLTLVVRDVHAPDWKAGRARMVHPPPPPLEAEAEAAQGDERADYHPCDPPEDQRFSTLMSHSS